MRLPYGHTYIDIDIPGATVLESRLAELQAGACGTSIAEASMNSPIGTHRLKELAAGRKTCTVIISDHTRPVPSRDILPPMLRELREGNPDIDITLLVATGCHRLTTPDEIRQKVGDEIAGSERIVVHDCDNNNVDIGVLPSGAHLCIDRLAAETDLLVAEGFIEPHFFAGFSGGRKSVLPGVCARETVLGNHCGRFIDSPYARTGVLEKNPIHEDMAAAARMAHLAYIVNVIVDEDQRTVAAFAGDPVKAHEAGVDFLRPYVEVCAVGAESKKTITGSVSAAEPETQACAEQPGSQIFQLAKRKSVSTESQPAEKQSAAPRSQTTEIQSSAPVFRQAEKQSADHESRPTEKRSASPGLADICITTNGGAPLDQNVYQCVKSMTAAEAATREGGVIIVCAECADGVGGEFFHRQLSECESPAQLYKELTSTPQSQTQPDAWQSQVLARILMSRKVIFVTRPQLKETIEQMKMTYAPTAADALKLARTFAGAEASITVIPNGISVIVGR